MIQWRIYYDDGTTFSDVDGDCCLAPGLGVQIVAQAHQEAGRELLCRQDYYWFDFGRWVAGDLFGLFDYLQRPGPRKVLLGRTIATEHYKQILKKAVNDGELPVKTARLPTEKY